MRVIPGAPSDRPEILYFGGATPEALDGRIREFLRRYPARPAEIPFFVDCVNPELRAQPRTYQKKFDQIYSGAPSGENTNNTILTTLFHVAEDFNLSGKEEYARIFAAEIRRFYRAYDAMLGPRKTPPHFTAWQLPAAVDVVEESASFTAEDLRHALELSRMLSERIMEHGDLRIPREIYEKNRRQYMTNHPINGIIAMYFNGKFLKERCALSAADYWIAMSEHGFESISGFPFGPEDSVAYQAFNLSLLIRYLIGSGKGGSAGFQTQEMRDYLAFCKAMVDPRGNIVNFGDGYPITSPTANGHFRKLLHQCYLQFGDTDTGFYLKRIQDFHDRRLSLNNIPKIKEFGKLPPLPAGKTTGILPFPLRQYKYQLLNRKPVYAHPAMDKAFFRSSWDPRHFLYACFTGINGGPHGHEDGNSLSSLVIDGAEWIGERDYVKRYAPDHNRISVIRNGQSFLFPETPDALWNFTQLCGSAESADHQRGVLAMLLENYNHADCRRDVYLDAKRGVFFLDRICARSEGDYLLESRFQVLAKPEGTPAAGNTRFTRPGKEFHIAGAEDADVQVFSRFESGSNAREDGYFGAYQAEGGANSAYWTARIERRLRTGETAYFVNRLHTGTAEPFGKIAENLWRTDSADPVLLGCGRQTVGNWTVDADFFVLTQDGLLGTGIRQGLPESAAPAEILHTIRSLPIRIPAPAKTASDLQKPFAVQTFASPVTALAQWNGTIAAGLQDGTLHINGKSCSFGQTITALAAIPDGKGAIQWAAGVYPAPGQKRSQLVLLTENLQEKWRFEPMYYQVHRPVIRDIFPVIHQTGAPPAIAIGTKAWMFLTVDQTTGKMLRRLPILHPATNGAAGDLDGDGIEEIIAGAEYYSSPIYNAAGKQLWNRRLMPYALHQLSGDLDQDGKMEFYSLRGNGTWTQFRAEHPQKSGRLPEITLTSGNTGGEALGGAFHQGKLYTLSSSGVLCCTDGETTVMTRSLGRQFTAFCGGESGLFAMDLQGVIVKIAPDGREICRYAAGFDPASIQPVLAVATPEGAAFASGQKIYLVK